MKILQVIPELGPGGAERFCEELTYELIAEGNEVLVASLFRMETILTRRMEAAGVKIVYLDKRLGLDLSCAKMLRSVIQNFQPDAIHTHLQALKYTVLAGGGKKAKIVHTIHSVAEKEAEGLDRQFNKLIFRLGKAVPVSLSREIQRTVLRLYHLKPEQSPIVHNGIRLENCIPKESYTLHSPVRIIHVGSFLEVKNHECMVEAAKLLPRSQYHFLFLGGGKLQDKIRQMASDHNLTEEFEFAGVSDNVYPYLHDSDIFLLPSKWEGMPMSVIEAMGTGLPVIASDVGGNRDILNDAVNGLLIQPEPKALAEAIFRLTADNMLRHRLGKNAREASSRFSICHTAEKYLKLYQN